MKNLNYRYIYTPMSGSNNLTGYCKYDETVFRNLKSQQKKEISTYSYKFNHKTLCEVHDYKSSGVKNIICTQLIKGIRGEHPIHPSIDDSVPDYHFGFVNCVKQGSYLYCQGYGSRETFEQTIFGKEEEKEK